MFYHLLQYGCTLSSLFIKQIIYAAIDITPQTSFRNPIGLLIIRGIKGIGDGIFTVIGLIISIYKKFILKLEKPFQFQFLES